MPYVGCDPVVVSEEIEVVVIDFAHNLQLFDILVLLYHLVVEYVPVVFMPFLVSREIEVLAFSEHDGGLGVGYRRYHFHVEVQVFLGDEGVGECFAARHYGIAVEHDIQSVRCCLGGDLECKVAASYGAFHNAGKVGFLGQIFRESEVVDRGLVVESRQTVDNLFVRAFDKSPHLVVERSGEAYKVAFSY